MALFLFLPFAGTGGANESFKEGRFTITTSDSVRHSLTVEIADTEQLRELGLMFRRTMASDHGMLFVFGTSRRVKMWMKNTYLPLDMLFLDRKGQVTSVVENAVPMSETIIDSIRDVDFVLELNAGIVSQLGIKAGDLMERAGSIIPPK